MKFLSIHSVYEKLDRLEKKIVKSNVKYLTAEEASKFLGFSITYLYELTSKRAIPFYKPSGKKLLFKHSELTEWIEKSRIDSSSEIQDKINNRTTG